LISTKEEMDVILTDKAMQLDDRLVKSLDY
jgi:hypothetical protein